jgi:hypothetical protein
MPPAATPPFPPLASTLPPGIAAYRQPVIAMVQPVANGTQGGNVPRDKPVVVYRFAAGEVSDPLDATSFAVNVNGPGVTESGRSRTVLFQVGANEAWGPLADPKGPLLAPGAYQVTARICSARGACASSTSTVTVSPSATDPSNTTERSQSRKEKLIDLLLSGAKRLLNP